jgi:hypothetical protein
MIIGVADADLWIMAALCGLTGTESEGAMRSVASGGTFRHTGLIHHNGREDD